MNHPITAMNTRLAVLTVVLAATAMTVTGLAVYSSTQRAQNNKSIQQQLKSLEQKIDAIPKRAP